MNWLIFVAIAVIFDSLRIYIDNYVSDVYFKGRGAVAQKFFYSWYNLIFAAVILIILGLNVSLDSIFILLLFVLSGLFSGFAGVPYCKALEIDDSTNLGIFTQLSPVLYLVLGWVFLGEQFSPIQLAAFVAIIAAPILIVATTRKRSRKVKLRAVFFAFMYVFIAVVGNLIFVKADDLAEWNLIQELALIFIGRGIADLLIVSCVKKLRKRASVVWKKSRKKVLRPITINFVVGFLKDIGYRGALVMAPAVAMASAASDAIEPIVIFFMGIILTLIWPKFGREKLNRKSIIIHLIATILVVIGISILQM